MGEKENSSLSFVLLMKRIEELGQLWQCGLQRDRQSRRKRASDSSIGMFSAASRVGEGFPFNVTRETQVLGMAARVGFVGRVL